jgi:exosortase D (VPLPA-CTERM-specific)
VLKNITDVKPASWIKLGLYGLLLLGIYHSTLTWLVTTDWGRKAYSYCWMIPLVVIFLIWIKGDELTSLASEPYWMGLIPICLGIVFFWLGELSGEFFTQYISFWLVLVGICLLHFGWKKLKIIGFALFFILTMFPLPNVVIANFTLKLQLISSQLGVSMIQLYGLPAYRGGNIIDLAFTRLQVVEACSGLHSMITLVVLCLLLVYFFKDHIWKRAVLLVSSIPLAIITNSSRIAMTAILHKHFGAEVAEGFFHGFSGLLIFLLNLPILLIEMWFLRKLPPSYPAPSSGAFVSNSSVSESNPAQKDAKAPERTAILQPVFVVAIILLGATLALSRGIDFREKIPMKQSFDHFPLQIGEWSGARQSMEQKVLDGLNLSDYVIIEYRNRIGKEVNFYVAYHGSQRKGEAIHSPESCLPGHGWIFEKAGIKAIPIPGYKAGFIHLNSAFMQKDGNKQLSYYWFLKQGRILTNLYQIKIFTFWDALTRQRTDGALVRLITPVYESEKMEGADARLQELTREVVPLLEEFVPQ